MTMLLISSTINYMINSIISQLMDHGIEATFAEATVDSVSKMGKKFDGIMMFADEKMTDESKFLIFIKDLSTEEGLPIFLLGYEEEIEEIMKSIPNHLIADKFARPINVTDIAKKLDNYFAKHNNGTKKKILVVDDSGSTLRMVKGWLEDRYQVILANSGMMAIKYLTQDNPDLVLLDYEMPVIDGKQVLEMIRSESDYSKVPVIFLTSKGDRESILEVMKHKPDGYMLKTMEPADIVKTIDEFFEKQKAIINS